MRYWWFMTVDLGCKLVTQLASLSLFFPQKKKIVTQLASLSLFFNLLGY